MILEMAGFILGRKYLSLKDIFIKKSPSAVCLVCTAIGKRIKYPKSSKHIQRLYRKKAECSKGLSSQSDQMDCRILQKRRYPLCFLGDIRNI